MHPALITARSTLHQAMRASFAEVKPYPTAEMLRRFQEHDRSLQELGRLAVWLQERLDEAVAELTGLYALMDEEETDGHGD